MIVSSKNYREKYPRKENAFEYEEKKPGLSANQPLNNWALVLAQNKDLALFHRQTYCNQS